VKEGGLVRAAFFRGLQGLKPNSILRAYAGAESPGLLKDKYNELPEQHTSS
jgi:hypothetical protein